MNFRNLTKITFLLALSFQIIQFPQGYKIVDTGQETCYDTLVIINCPAPGEQYYGQDSQFDGNQFDFQYNDEGTITDLNTGLIWQQFLFEDKYSYENAIALADTFSLSGFADWRLPSIKELYSLIDFRGATGVTAAESTPFIDTTYFEFRYGNINAGERFIDAQYVSSTEYVGTTMNGDFTVFGVNFADGRIKGYGTTAPTGGDKLFEVKLLRGNTEYGTNNFSDNNDGTITDISTGLMWGKEDNGTGLNWEEALDWVSQKNQDNYLDYNDWRLPNAKELQSIVDYTRSPQTTNSPAIDTIFNVTPIIDEGGEINYPFYWTGTTHADGPPDHQFTKAVYVAFGEALGFMEIPPISGNYVLMDVHGAGAQRSDPKQGDPNNYPHGFGPQGDVIRIYNFVRLVRDDTPNSTGREESGLPDNFRLEQNYPNPFNPTTTIKFSIPTSPYPSPYQGEGTRERFLITLIVYDILGNKIATLVNEEREAGHYKTNFDASHLASGMYIYRLSTDNFVSTKKMILIK